MDTINGISYYLNKMLDATKHITDNVFLSGRQRIGAHALCVQHGPSNAALSTSFLLNHAPNRQPQAERIDYKIWGVIE